MTSANSTRLWPRVRSRPRVEAARADDRIVVKRSIKGFPERMERS